jgi:hypothetical protein
VLLTQHSSSALAKNNTLFDTAALPVLRLHAVQLMLLVNATVSEEGAADLLQLGKTGMEGLHM